MLEFLIKKASEETLRAISKFIGQKISLKEKNKDGFKFKIDNRKALTSVKDHLSFVKLWSNKIDILGMPKPKNLDGIYIELSLTDDPRRFRFGKPCSDSLCVDEILVNSRQLAILGDPGSGKTTTIKMIAKKLLSEEKKNGKIFPVIVRLRDFNNKQTLLNFICDLFEIKLTASEDEYEKKKVLYEKVMFKAISVFIEKINVFLLIDGLDELHSNSRDGVIKEINRITSNSSNIAIVLTCRSADFVRKPNGFSVFEIDEMSEIQKSIFTASWFGSKYQRKRTSKEFSEELSKTPYQDLANKPLTLANLCLIFEKYGSLPSMPVSVYRKIINLYIEEWDAERGVVRNSKYSQFDSYRKLDFLALFAYTLVFKKRSGSSFTATDLTEIYRKICNRFGLPKDEASEVAKEIESHTGIIVKVAYDTFEFFHKSLQEYLVAEHLTKLRRKPNPPELLKDCPNELAIALALSGDPCEWFCSIFRDSRGRLKRFNTSLTPFLRRLSIERPTFGCNGEFGATVLWAWQRWEKDWDAFQRFAVINDVGSSIDIFLKNAKISSSNQKDIFRGKDVVKIFNSEDFSGYFPKVNFFEIHKETIEKNKILKEIMKPYI